jgi:hypothetical protein
MPLGVLQQQLVVRRRRQKLEFTPELRHLVSIAPDSEGRPGEVFRSPSKPAFPPYIDSGGAREDFRVLLGKRGSSFAAVCLGPTAQLGGARESAYNSRDSWHGRGRKVSLQVTPETVTGEPAYRYRIELATGTLVEWKLEHAGWLYVLGVLVEQLDREQQMVDRARALMSTWQWLPSGVTAA